MNEYHKIQTVFKRDPATRYKTLLDGEYSMPEFEYLKDNDWTFTEKVDGTNIRVIWDGKEIIFKGKTDNSQTPFFLIDALNKIFKDKEEVFKSTFKDTEVYLFGEGYGAKIQKGGGNYRKDNSFVLFDIKIGRWWLKREDVESIAKTLGIEVVPIVGHGTLDDMVRRVRRGFYSHWGYFLAEGIVARPSVELMDRAGERIITKLKHKDFTKEVKICETSNLSNTHTYTRIFY